jgi:hypothetical protein
MFRKVSVLWITTLLFLAGVAVPRQSAEADDEFPPEYAWHRITPSIAWCGDAVRVEVHIVGRTDVVGVQAVTGSGDATDLFDDASHGDALAGDNVFTNSEVYPACNPDWLIREHDGLGRSLLDMRVQLSDGRELSNNYPMIMGVVHPDFKDVFDVVDLGNGLSATAYAFFIEDSMNEVFEGYPVAELYCGRGNYEAFLKFYSVMPDDFDFTLLMPGMQMLLPTRHTENTPYDVLVSNAVQNIGMDIVDNTGRFGSAGRLKSMIYHSFGSLSVFDHEILHTWGAAIGSSLGLLEYAGNQSHWNKMSDIAGQMTAFYFADSGDIGRFAHNGDGTWHLVSNMEVPPYSPLELYVMGLIPPEEVPPIHILQSPDLSDLERITAASYQTITIEQIMSAEGGPRIPSADEAQRDFTLAFIVTQDVPYNDAAYAFFSLLSYDLMSLDPPHSYTNLAPFNWATGGRATLDVRLPVDLPEPVGPEPLQAPPEAPTTTEEATAATTEPDTDEPEATPTPGFPPFCPSVMAGMIALPGLLAVLRRRKWR